MTDSPDREAPLLCDSSNFRSSIELKQESITKYFGFPAANPTATCTVRSVIEESLSNMNSNMDGSILSEANTSWSFADAPMLFNTSTINESAMDTSQSSPPKETATTSTKHQCQICKRQISIIQQGYIRAGAAIAHAVLHLGASEKQFECSECGIRKKSANYVTTHIQQKHKGRGNVVDLLTVQLLDRIREVTLNCFPDVREPIEVWYNGKLETLTGVKSSTTITPSGPRPGKTHRYAQFDFDENNELIIVAAPEPESTTPSDVTMEGDSTLPLDDTLGEEFGEEGGENTQEEKADGLSVGEDAGNITCKGCKKTIVGASHHASSAIAHAVLHMKERRYGCSLCDFQHHLQSVVKKHCRVVHDGLGYPEDRTTLGLIARIFAISNHCFPEMREKVDANLEPLREVLSHQERNAASGGGGVSSADVGNDNVDGGSQSDDDSDTDYGRPPKAKKAKRDPSQFESKKKQTCRLCGTTPTVVSENKFRVDLALAHASSHTSTKRYHCTHCEYQSPHRSSVADHIKSRHGKTVPPKDVMDHTLLVEFRDVTTQCFPDGHERISAWYDKELVQLEAKAAAAAARESDATVIDEEVENFGEADSDDGGEDAGALDDSVTGRLRERQQPVPEKKDQYEKCSKCRRLVRLFPRYLWLHATAHVRLKRYFCSECPYKGVSQQIVRRHIVQTHQDAATVIDKTDMELLNRFHEAALACYPSQTDMVTGYYQERVDALRRKLNSFAAEECGSSEISSTAREGIAKLLETCLMCGKQMGSNGASPSWNALNHAMGHVARRRFGCSACPYECMSVGILTMHLKKHHTPEENAEVVDRADASLFDEFHAVSKRCFPHMGAKLDEWYEDEIRMLNARIASGEAPPPPPPPPSGLFFTGASALAPINVSNSERSISTQRTLDDSALPVMQIPMLELEPRPASAFASTIVKLEHCETPSFAGDYPLGPPDGETTPKRATADESTGAQEGEDASLRHQLLQKEIDLHLKEVQLEEALSKIGCLKKFEDEARECKRLLRERDAEIERQRKDLTAKDNEIRALQQKLSAASHRQSSCGSSGTNDGEKDIMIASLTAQVEDLEASKKKLYVTIGEKSIQIADLKSRLPV